MPLQLQELRLNCGGLLTVGLGMLGTLQQNTTVGTRQTQMVGTGWRLGKVRRRLWKWPSVYHIAVCVLKHYVYCQVATKIPVPAPRRKKEQISPEISSVVTSKTPDNIITGNCAGSKTFKISYSEDM